MDSYRSVAPALEFRNYRGWTANCFTCRLGNCDAFDAIPMWTDGTCSVFQLPSNGGAGKYHYCYEGLVEAVVDFATRNIDLLPLDPDCTQATLDHFLADVLLPGILDHQGDLVLHAGAVIIEGAAALFVGASGRGKSTLTASFYAAGHTVLSDDGIIVTCSAAGTSVEAVYPGIRLLPQTLSDLFVDSIATTDVAHYATKRRIVPDGRMSAARFPAAALFFLSESNNSGLISIKPVGAADACIGIVGKSFALDPSDKDRARARIGQASRLATAVPIFALDFPRNISILPQVRQAIAGTIAHARRAGGGSLAEQCI